MSTVIKVEELGKSYIIDHEQRERYTALRDVIARKAKKIFSFNDSTNKQIHSPTKEEFWALKDISFEVNLGERIGIIGRNGAGKSTLLKILSRITEPTTGSVKIKGRVASLLEVGTGFHPELTGAENIYLNGAILGMSRVEVKKKFDEIVDFAGTEKFLDTPVKRYSSGMYVRLAFAVAAHIEPDILVVDEVLSVGDAEFQKKCLGKMEDVSNNEGRTVLFVSHNMAAVNTLTAKSICLVYGKIAKIGITNDVINYYLKNFDISLKRIYTADKDPNKPSFTRIAIKTSESDGTHKNGEDLEINFEINMPYVIEGMGVSFQIFSENGIPVIYGYVFDTDMNILRTIGHHKLQCIIPKCKLYQGNYYIKAHLAESKGGDKFEEIDNICSFEVVMLDKTIEWGWQKNVCTYTENFYWNI